MRHALYLNYLLQASDNARALALSWCRTHRIRESALGDWLELTNEARRLGKTPAELLSELRRTLDSPLEDAPVRLGRKELKLLLARPVLERLAEMIEAPFGVGQGVLDLLFDHEGIADAFFSMDERPRSVAECVHRMIEEIEGPSGEVVALQYERWPDIFATQYRPEERQRLRAQLRCKDGDELAALLGPFVARSPRRPHNAATDLLDQTLDLLALANLRTHLAQLVDNLVANAVSGAQQLVDNAGSDDAGDRELLAAILFFGRGDFKQAVKLVEPAPERVTLRTRGFTPLTPDRAARVRHHVGSVDVLQVVTFKPSLFARPQRVAVVARQGEPLLEGPPEGVESQLRSLSQALRAGPMPDDPEAVLDLELVLPTAGQQLWRSLLDRTGMTTIAILSGMEPSSRPLGASGRAHLVERPAPLPTDTTVVEGQPLDQWLRALR